MTNKELVMEEHRKIMEVETIAMNAVDAMLETGLNRELAIKLFLHNCVMKPAVTYLDPAAELNVLDYAYDWILECHKHYQNKEPTDC